MFIQDLAKEVFPPACASVQEAPGGRVLTKQGSKQTKTRGLGGTEGNRGPQGMAQALVAAGTAAPDNSTSQQASRRAAPRGMGALQQTKRLDYLISLKEHGGGGKLQLVWGRKNEVKSNSGKQKLYREVLSCIHSVVSMVKIYFILIRLKLEVYFKMVT